MEKRKNESSGEAPIVGEYALPHVSAVEATLTHLICGLFLAVALWLPQSVNLISDPSSALRIICVIECPVVILLYSRLRTNPDQCSYWRAVGQGVMAFPVGALLNALGAIALGAPVGFQYLSRTINWACMMSTFTFVPVASLFGSSWSDWQINFAYTKPIRTVDYMACFPAHGAIIGAWFGAWPMPLDWERPWQDWPICVSYGALLGYLVGTMASLSFIFLGHGRLRTKVD